LVRTGLTSTASPSSHCCVAFLVDAAGSKRQQGQKTPRSVANTLHLPRVQRWRASERHSEAFMLPGAAIFPHCGASGTVLLTVLSPIQPLLPCKAISRVGEQQWPSYRASIGVGHEQASIQVCQQPVTQAESLLGGSSDIRPAIELMTASIPGHVVSREGVEGAY